MAQQELKRFKDCRWIVIRGTRYSVSFILSCLAEGMSIQEIEDTYGQVRHESIPEVLKAASELLDAPNVAA